MTQVKICGLCRACDAALALAAGADYVGVILAPNRQRSQSLRAAAEIFSGAPGARRVGVFVDPNPGELTDAINTLSLNVVQLHGSESPELARAFAHVVEVWKAVSVQAPGDLADAARIYQDSVSALLLDAFHPLQAGGTGIALDWPALAPERHALPAQLRLVLAGGLTHYNVAEAMLALAPQVVDVSSGVERAIGEKSDELIRYFVTAARNPTNSGNLEGTRR